MRRSIIWRAHRDVVNTSIGLKSIYLDAMHDSQNLCSTAKLTSLLKVHAPSDDGKLMSWLLIITFTPEFTDIVCCTCTSSHTSDVNRRKGVHAAKVDSDFTDINIFNVLFN